MAACVPRRDVPCPASLSFSDVRRLPVEAHVRRCVLANVGQCIPRGQRQPELARWELVRRFRLLERRVLAAVPVVRRDVPASAMFLAG